VVARELGCAVLETFDRLPEEITEVNLATARQPYIQYLKANGFDGPREFEKNSDLVGAYSDGNAIEVIPHKKDENTAFIAVTKKILPMAATPEQLGEALLRAFAFTL
jgi:hypothetical protein